jgi:small subunit ribosomal protein S1
MVNNRNHHVSGGSEAFQPTLDEGWWASLLTDEELNLAISTARRESVTGGKRGGNGGHGHSHESPAPGHDATAYQPSALARPTTEDVDWEFIQAIFASDETLSLIVSGYNRGGLLVDGEHVHGFLPVSHLLDVPSELSIAPEFEREKVLAQYVGQRLEVKVIECDPERGRVVFSERAAQASVGRRNELLTELKTGECVQGVITNLTDFGVFIDLGGIEGLVHISEISWGRVRHPEDLLKVGEPITAYVIQVDRDRGRIALSLKRLCSNPWTTVDQRYRIGEIVEATVTSLVPFGAFARIEEGLDGLIHISEMRGEDHPFIEEGQTVKARILHIDAAKQRLGLSLNVD